MNESKLLTDRELEILYSIPAPQFVPFVIHRAGVQPRSVAQAALLDELPADLLTEVLRWPAPDLQAAREANAARVEAEAVRRLEQHQVGHDQQLGRGGPAHAAQARADVGQGHRGVVVDRE